MLHVALFVPSLRGGGAERVMVNLAEGFAQRGAQVDLVTVRAEGQYLALLSPMVKVIDLKASRVLTSLPSLVHYLRREKPTTLVSAMDHANAIAVCAQRIARVPTRVIATVHNTPSQVVANARTLRARLLPVWTRFFYRWADKVVAVSQGVADELVHYVGIPAEKVKVIYNPIVTPDLFQKAEEPLEHPWFQDGEPPVVLGVGRLTKQKDFPTLIRAFALVRRQRLVRLMILGEGEERSMLEALVRELGIEQDVALPGFVQNPYPYMKKAAVFVLSSRWEGLPTVLVEALALGTPVVATDCPSGPREILQNGRWGYLAAVGDTTSLAESILCTMDDPRRVPERRLEQFSLETALKEYSLLAGMKQPK